MMPTHRILGLFPQTPYALASGALLNRTLVPPDPASPFREPVALDVSTWTQVRRVVEAGGIDELSIRIPADFVGQFREREGNAPGAMDRLGEWHSPRRHCPGRENLSADLSLMVIRTPTHVTVGTGPATEQVDLEECRVQTGDETLHLLLFTLRDELPAKQEEFWVSGLWEILPDAWLMAHGQSWDRQTQMELRAVLESLRFTRHPK